MRQQTPGVSKKSVTDGVLTDLLYVSDVRVLDFSNQRLRPFLFALILKTNFPCGPLVAGFSHLAAVTRGGEMCRLTGGWQKQGVRGKTCNNKVSGVAMTRL